MSVALHYGCLTRTLTNRDKESVVRRRYHANRTYTRTCSFLRKCFIMLIFHDHASRTVKVRTSSFSHIV